MLVAEGSLQSGTFFHRYLEQSGHSSQIWGGEVSGQSSNGAYWFVDGRAVRGNAGRVQISEPESTALIRANSKSIESLLQLRFAGWFGLRMLVPQSVKWEGDRFEALWHNSQWPFDTNTVPVVGEVAGYSNNLPTAIRLKSPAWPKPYQYINIVYSYAPSSSLQYYPVGIQSEVVLDNGVIRGQTVDEIRVVFGVREIPGGGFKPADFLPSATSQPPLTIVASNAGVYFVVADGRVEPIGSVLHTKSGYPKQILRLIFGLFLGVPLVFLWLLARGRRSTLTAGTNQIGKK